ncbi:MAG: VacJ family lipoprotein [Pseudomonadota bacterium]
MEIEGVGARARLGAWRLRALLTVGAFVLLSGCASVGGTGEPSQDPLEGINRKVLAFNDGADRALLKPLARGYQFITPNPLETGVSNFFLNLRTPWTAVNQLLQGKPKLALADTGRFLLNSTAGIGGLFDVATDSGLEAHREDFGQTLAVWGVPSGNYAVVPFAGPSTLRDGLAGIVDTLLYPVRFIEDDTVRWSLLATDVVQTRAKFLSAEALLRGDRYLFVRDAYLQRREYLINDGEIEEDPFLD